MGVSTQFEDHLLDLLQEAYELIDLLLDTQQSGIPMKEEHYQHAKDAMARIKEKHSHLSEHILDKRIGDHSKCIPF